MLASLISQGDFEPSFIKKLTNWTSSPWNVDIHEWRINWTRSGIDLFVKFTSEHLPSTTHSINYSFASLKAQLSFKSTNIIQPYLWDKWLNIDPQCSHIHWMPLHKVALEFSCLDQCIQQSIDTTGMAVQNELKTLD